MVAFDVLGERIWNPWMSEDRVLIMKYHPNIHAVAFDHGHSQNGS